MCKKCTKCKELRPIEEYHVIRGKPTSRCKKCRNEINRLLRAKVKNLPATCFSCGKESSEYKIRSGRRHCCEKCQATTSALCHVCNKNKRLKDFSRKSSFKKCKECFLFEMKALRYRNKAGRHLGSSTPIEYVSCNKCKTFEVKKPNRTYEDQSKCYRCNVKDRNRLGSIRRRPKRKEGRKTNLIRLDCCVDCGKSEWIRPNRKHLGPRCYDCTIKKRSRVFAAINYIARPSKKCYGCDKHFKNAFGEGYNYCKECRKTKKFKSDKKVRRERVRKRSCDVKFNKEQIFKRDKWKCQMCGIKTHKRDHLLPDAAELDHIVPLSKGGRHIPSNLQCLCRACNRKKGDSLIGQSSLFSPVLSSDFWASE
jgi:5-methylcytosine-specific restriction endonuclease McrA